MVAQLTAALHPLTCMFTLQQADSSLHDQLSRSKERSARQLSQCNGLHSCKALRGLLTSEEL